MQALGDFDKTQTVSFKWPSAGQDGASITPVGGTIEVYKGGDVAQSVAGVTDDRDFDGLVGLHHVAIDLSDAFYTTAANYDVVLAGATIDGQAVNTLLASFSIDNRSAIKTLQAAEPREKTRDSDVLTTGTQTGTSANTLARDGVYWQITSVAAGLDAELVFNIGTGAENPSSLQLSGRFESGNNRQTLVQGFNFDLDLWEKLGADVLGNENTDKEYIWGLGRSYVRRGQAGTPGSDGDVRIRFLYDTSVSGKVQAGDDLYLDKVAVYYTSEAITLGEVVQALVLANPQRNYPGGIVVNTEGGQPGQDFGINGMPGNPSSNLADAIVLAGKGGYRKLIVEGNSTLILTQGFPDWTFVLAQGSILDVNGQDVDNSTFLGGTLQGVAVNAATGIRARGCTLKGVTAWGTFEACNLPAADSLVANGNQVFLLDCESIRPGGANPSIKGGAVAGLSLSVIKYGGGIDIAGLADDAKVTISGRGSFQLTDAATTAEVIASGNMRLIGALPTGLVYVDTARVTQTTPMNLGAVGGTAVGGPDDLKADVSALALEATLVTVGNVAADTNTKISQPGDYKADVSALALEGNVQGHVDAALDASVAELAGPPPADGSLRADAKWCAMKARNEGAQDATSRTVKNDAGAVIATATVADDQTTFVRSKFT